MGCDLCGKDISLVLALVESVELSLCDKCAGHGKILSRQIKVQDDKPQFKQPIKKIHVDPIVDIDEDYSSKVRNARQKRNLSQKDLAKLLAEKESVVHNVENGSLEPSIDLAKKFEKELGIKLIITGEDSTVATPRSRKSQEVTLGDLVKIRKRS